VLHLTSLVFTTNAAHAFAKGLGAYGIAFASLVITSVLYHMGDTKEPILFWYDQMMVWLVISIGFLYFVCAPRMVALCAFLVVAVLYAGGYCTETLCFSPSKETQTTYHALLHIVSSLGHHVIISAF
jgi:hypothetical protein